MKHLTTLLFVFTLSYFNLLNAQECENNWGFGIGYTLTQATGATSDNGYGTNHGFFTDVFYLGIRNKNFSISPGLRFNLGSSFGDRVDVRIPEPDIEIGYAQMTNYYADLKLATRVGFLESEVIKPYGELSSGLRYSAANQVFGLNDNNFDPGGDFGNPTNTDQLNTSYTHVYGFGIGALVSVSDRIDIDVRVNQDWAGSMTYLDLREGLDAEFLVNDNVKTISYNLGIRYRFGCEVEESPETY